MTDTTRLWDVRGALVAIFTAALQAKVYDGPPPKTSLPERYLIVGGDGGDTGIGDGLTDGSAIDQQSSDMGNGWRDETGEVVCSAWAWSGSTGFPPLRTAVQAIVAVCETAIRADRTLGGVVTPPGLAEFNGMRFREIQTNRGAATRAAFTVAYTALIT